jgi:hypothetical protein
MRRPSFRGAPETAQVRLGPVGGYFPLRLARVELAITDYFAKPVFEVVFQLGRPFPLDRPTRLRPEVLVVVRAAEGLV